jgi:putative ABC transport system permease protein
VGDSLFDLRYASRALAKKPGFTAIAVLTLALGIGANTAIFSVANGILLRPLPFGDADRLVLLWQSKPESGWNQLPVSYPNFSDWKERSQSFDGMAAFFSYADSTFNLSEGEEPERVQAAYVTANLFSQLGARPERGRGFLPEEDRRGSSPVVVLGDGLWKRRFGSDPAIVGKSIQLDGESHRVVGIMPRSFTFPRFPKDADLWLPLAQEPNAGRQFSRGTKYLTVLAKLKPGVGLAEAQSEMDTLASALEEQFSGILRGNRVKVVPLQSQAAGDLKVALMVLLGAVGFVLLIACANVANLILARAVGRKREIAIRTAVGASRWRITRLLLSESLILALLGGALGLLLALWGVDFLALLPYNPPSFTRPYQVSPDQIGVDLRVLGFTLLLSLFTGLLFGLAPAYHASRASLTEALRAIESASTGVFRRHSFRSLLVVSEIALSSVLLIGAGLMIQSFRQLSSVSPGFQPENVLTFEVGLARSRYVRPEQMAGFSEALLQRLASLPGVRAAGAVEHLPLSGGDEDTGFYLEGHAAPAPAEMPHAHPRSVSPDYFRAMRIRLLRGRAFSAADTAASQRVAVINETMARRFWNGEDPLGRRVALDFESLRFFPDRPPQLDLESGMREIVGVVADVRAIGLDSEPVPELYTPLTQRPAREMSFVMRGAGDPAQWSELIRSEVRSVDPGQAVSSLRSMDEVLSTSVARPRFNTLLLTLFAGMALILAMVGVYGVISYSVSHRTREIGIRMALGAQRREVMVMIVKEGLIYAATGLVLGAAGALALTRALSGLLYGISPTDPWTFALVPVLLCSAALLACYLPARKATRIDPMLALRHE